MPRRRLERPTPKMKDMAIRALDQMVEAEDTPVHVRMSAARALTQPGRDEAADDCAYSFRVNPKAARASAPRSAGFEVREPGAVKPRKIGPTLARRRRPHEDF